MSFPFTSRIACVVILATFSLPAAWAAQLAPPGNPGAATATVLDLRVSPPNPNNPYKLYILVENAAGGRGQVVNLKGALLTALPNVTLSPDYINFQVDGKFVGTAKMPAPGVPATLAWTIPADMALGDHLIEVKDPYYLPPGKARLTVVPSRTSAGK